ncbi:hypothetical protein GCM10010123_16240 [Pilimelia anulata]|uniref:Ricin B lectin domain-containing protein n=1 Tax=Pilimelia anulata TaxID=53371 RepID=A0A8J3B8K3_9ACTN|nr:hypothetical protein [Pilimelia anulata]GGJ87386.1 hypothetical protein GCM10010123_16240 [Pilimelia anulata]
MSGRRRWWRDERGSLPMVLLLTLVGVSLSAVITPTVVRQAGATREAVSRERELDAARAGLAVAQARIRGAVDPARPGVLDRTRLPCGTPLAGTVDAAGSAIRYRVEISYFAGDPLAVGATALPCATGGGPGTAPAYARLRSWGSAAAAGEIRRPGEYRYLAGTYVFAAVRAGFDPNVPRQISLYSPPQTVLGTFGFLLSPVMAIFLRQKVCLDAGTDAAVPPAGTPLTGRDCATRPTLRQNFLYRDDLALMHAGSYAAGRPMCVDAGDVHTAGRQVTLEPCGSGQAGWRHRWYYNSANNFEGVKPQDGPRSADELDGFCLNRPRAAVGGAYPIILGTAAAQQCHKEIPDGLAALDVFSDLLNLIEGYGLQSWSFLDDVGPGLAGDAQGSDCTVEAGRPCRAGQLVNVGLRSMCLEHRLGELYGPMVAKECTEHPVTDRIDPEQLWHVPLPAAGQTSATGPIYQVVDGRTYCLSANDQAASQVIGGLLALVTLTSDWPDFAGRAACNPKTASGALLWRVNGDTGNAAASFRIESTSTRQCLAVGEESDLNKPNLATLITQVMQGVARLLGTQIALPLDPFVYEWTGTHNGLKVVLRTCSGSDRQKWASPLGQPLPAAGAAAPAAPGAGQSSEPRALRDIAEEEPGPAGAGG